MGITIDFSRMLPAFPREAVAQLRPPGSGRCTPAWRSGAPPEACPSTTCRPRTPRDLKACARRLEGRFANLVVLGIGGSALGLIALNSALRTPYRWAEKAPRLYVLDNIDPERVRTLLDALDPRETLVNVITKSGDTAETMASFLIFREWLRAGAGEAGLPRADAGDHGPRQGRAAPDSRPGPPGELRGARRGGRALLGADPGGPAARRPDRHRRGRPAGRGRGHGRADRQRGADGEPGLPGRGPALSGLAGRPAHLGDAGLLGPALRPGGLVPAAVGREPGQARRPGRRRGARRAPPRCARWG